MTGPPQAGAALLPGRNQISNDIDITIDKETPMTTLPSAAAQLENVLQSVLHALGAPGAWLADTLPFLLLPSAILLTGAALLALLHHRYH